MGLGTAPPPPFIPLEPPPIPADYPTEVGGGAGVLIIIVLAIEAVGLWRGRIAASDYDADWIDWLTNPQRELVRRRAKRIANHCCEIIADEGARAVQEVPDVFEPNEIFSDNNAKRYGRVSKSRRN